MDNNVLDKIIDNFNFNEKEAKVYLAALKLGKSRASDIAKETKLNRITVYEILKRFRQKGLATSMAQKKVLTFQVIDPQNLIERMERQLALSKNLVPDLLLLKGGDKNRPKIEYYEGVEGIKSLYEDTLSCKEKVIHNVTNPENLLRVIGEDFMEEYIKRRATKKIKARVLFPANDIGRKYFERGEIDFREAKFFDEKNFPIPNEIMIYDNKVSLLSFSSKIGVIIEDADIAKSLLSIWSFFWTNSKIGSIICL